MGPVNIVTALHRIAKHEDCLDVHGDAMFQMLNAAAQNLAHEGAFDPRGLANTAWSFAPLVLADGPLLHAISAAALRKSTDFYG